MKAIPYNSQSKKQVTFDSSMLGIGEMMELYEVYPGDVVIRAHDSIVRLNNPNSTWNKNVKLLGRKLMPGEGITLIQE